MKIVSGRKVELHGKTFEVVSGKRIILATKKTSIVIDSLININGGVGSKASGGMSKSSKARSGISKSSQVVAGVSMAKAMNVGTNASAVKQGALIVEHAPYAITSEGSTRRKVYVTLEQMIELGWKELHCGYIDTSTGKDSPLNDMTSEITRKTRKIKQGDVDKINALFNKYQINTKKRIVAFFAECSAETGNGIRFLEAAGTKKVPLIGTSTRTNINKWFDDNKLYGSKYRGAGAIQITWDYHYKDFEIWMKKEFKKTDSDITKKGAEYVAMSYPWEAAVFYWSKNNLNSKADTGNIHAVTAVVNQDMSNDEYKKREDAYDTWNKKYVFPTREDI
jgi:predicted chitinase